MNVKAKVLGLALVMGFAGSVFAAEATASAQPHRYHHKAAKASMTKAAAMEEQRAVKRHHRRHHRHHRRSHCERVIMGNH